MSFDERFGGIARLYGAEALARFAAARVCVIGIGGVGSWAAEALARSGIGGITLIDMDDICITNTNRQIHALSNRVGAEKTAAMAERIALINPDCEVRVVDDFIGPDNLEAHLLAGFDHVLDAIDSVRAKAALIAFCKRNKIPVITAGGAGGQIDPSQIQLADLSRTIQDPLAAKVRGELRRNYQFSKNPKRKFGVDCVFSTEQPRYPDGSGGICRSKQQSDGTMKMDCASGFGAATHITATFGFFMVGRVLAKLAAEAGSEKPEAGS
ncbi:sulfur acceptor protein CsdL [Zobellella denitrificans]|uniref:tRNA threonylcarbamoyladenosine dehydratase n=1 Tax=Zobellella denitrificans TaxID=347534 RepID=A0A291HTE2_9GAMM|nr:tRNA cyclic N6-threonylcarbamoyladenosine(37) synthase TcdA [Zobellella denitrificans]ATG75425.1 sulfur acceptor protein CsdL [Zobellella denitrificans]